MGSKQVSRRAFLGGAALTGVVSAGILAGCSQGSGGSGSGDGKGAADGESADVIVVGSGMAGMTCALKLVEQGVDTLIVDKGEALNMSSNSAFSSGMFCYPLDETDESKEKLYQIFMKKCKNEGSEELTRLIVDRVYEGMEWLKSYGGGEFTDSVVDAATGDFQTCFAAPGASQGMGPLLQTLAETYRSNGGREKAGAKVLDFVVGDSGAVEGVKVRTSEGIETIAAKAVIIAGGGYVANRLLMELFCGPEADAMMMRGNKANTGDVTLAAARCGALLYEMGGIEQTIHAAAVTPDAPAAGNPYLATPFCLAINADGKRYVDESLGYVSNGKALMNQSNPVCALVFDQTILDAQPTTVQVDWDKYVNMDMGRIEASSIDDLAEQIGVDAATLNATISEFNAATDGKSTKGLSPEKANNALPLQGPNYYAFYPLKPGSMMAFGGLKVNEKCQVLEADDTPISGLYAAGECLGGVFKYDYQGGGSLARCVATGLQAAESAAASVK